MPLGVGADRRRRVLLDQCGSTSLDEHECVVAVEPDRPVPGRDPGVRTVRIEIERPAVVVGSDLLAGADLEADGVDQCSECVAHHHEHVLRAVP